MSSSPFTILEEIILKIILTTDKKLIFEINLENIFRVDGKENSY
jgi:hypothetical protein